MCKLKTLLVVYCLTQHICCYRSVMQNIHLCHLWTSRSLFIHSSLCPEPWVLFPNSKSSVTLQERCNMHAMASSVTWCFLPCHLNLHGHSLSLACSHPLYAHITETDSSTSGMIILDIPLFCHNFAPFQHS